MPTSNEYHIEIEKYLTLEFRDTNGLVNTQGLGTQMIFSNTEVKDIGETDTVYPEVYTTAGGFGVSAPKLQPRKWKFEIFGSWEEATYYKMRKIVEYVGLGHKVFARIESGYLLYQGGSNEFVSASAFMSNAIIKFDKDTTRRTVVRGKGMLSSVPFKFELWEAKDLVVPDDGGVITGGVIIKGIPGPGGLGGIGGDVN